MSTVHDTTTPTQKKHNGIISFWKFAFMLMIIVHHEFLGYSGDNVFISNFVRFGGVIGVTFFFVVSGFLMTKSALKTNVEPKNLGKATWQYLLKKIKRFFPYLLVTYAILLVLGIATNRYNLSQAIDSIWNLSFATMSGVRFTVVIDILWYISAMLICMLIFWPLIVKYKRNFLLLVCPILVIFMAGYLSQKYNGLATIYQFNGLFYDGVIRAAVCMLSGSLAYLLSERISTTHSKSTTVILTIVEFCGFSAMFILAGIQQKDYSILELVILSCCTAIAFSEKSLLLKICSNRLFFYLESLSLSLLFTHRIVIRYLNWVKPADNAAAALACYLITAILVSALMMIIINGLEKLISSIKARKYKTTPHQ